MTYDDLKTKYDAGEISFEEYVSSTVTPGSFVIKDSPKRGRRAAKRQGDMVKRLEPFISSPKLNGEPMPAAQAAPHATTPGEDNAQGDDRVGSGNLATVATALAFITAGNAHFTVRSLKTGARYTFAVNLGKAKPGYCGWCRRDLCVCKQPFFVKYLSGPENTTDYTYLGMIRDNVYATTKASARLQGSTVDKAFSYVWRNLITRTLPPQTEIWHEGRCGRCGRLLTVPASIEAGIGPECASKMEGGF